MGLYFTSQWTGLFGRLKKVQTKDRETEKKLTVEIEHKKKLNLSQLLDDDDGDDDDDEDSSMNDNTVPINTKPNLKRKRKSRTKKKQKQNELYAQKVKRVVQNTTRATKQNTAQVSGVNVNAGSAGSGAVVIKQSDINYNRTCLGMA